jgi:hypothetical protein
MKLNLIYQITSFSFPIILIYLIFIKIYQWAFQSKEVIGGYGKIVLPFYQSQILRFFINAVFISTFSMIRSIPFGFGYYISLCIIISLVFFVIRHSIIYKKSKENFLGVLIATLIFFVIHFHIYNFFDSINGLDGGEITYTVVLSMIGFNIAFYYKSKSIVSQLQSYLLVQERNPTLHRRVQVENVKNDVISTYPRITICNEGEKIFDSSDFEIINKSIFQIGSLAPEFDYIQLSGKGRYAIKDFEIELMEYFEDYSILYNDSQDSDIKFSTEHLGLGIPYNIHMKFNVTPFIEKTITEEERISIVKQQLERLRNRAKVLQERENKLIQETYPYKNDSYSSKELKRALERIEDLEEEINPLTEEERCKKISQRLRDLAKQPNPKLDEILKNINNELYNE